MVTRLIICFFLVFCTPGLARANSPEPLRVHGWVDYFPAWLLEEFTKETGIPVLLSFFADNHVLYRSLRDQGAMLRYDVVTPSGEMVQRLADEGLLLPLNKRAIQNAQDIDPWFDELGYDPGGKYSVPIFWGVLGMAIDRRVVADSVSSTIFGYADLWRPEFKGKLVLPNDFRSLMSIMLLSLHYSVNDTNMAHLEEALQALKALAPSVRHFDTVDQEEAMAKSSTGLGVVWGKESFSHTGPESLYQFILPKEGSPVWVDTLAVASTSTNREGAHAFINFVLRPDVLARLSTGSGYAVASLKAQALVPESLRNNSVVYPPIELRYRFEAEKALPPEADVLKKRWMLFKSNLGK